MKKILATLSILAIGTTAGNIAAGLKTESKPSLASEVKIQSSSGHFTGKKLNEYNLEFNFWCPGNVVKKVLSNKLIKEPIWNIISEFIKDDNQSLKAFFKNNINNNFPEDNLESFLKELGEFLENSYSVSDLKNISSISSSGGIFISSIIFSSPWILGYTDDYKISSWAG